MPRLAIYSPEHVRRTLWRLHRRSGRQLGIVASSAGMPVAQLSDILHGRRANPGVGTIGRILHALDATWAEFDSD